MEGPRRIELMPAESIGKAVEKKGAKQTLRFMLTLGESSTKTCPEFSYTELLRNRKGELGIEENPFAEEDDFDEVAAIAQSFEAKYGPKPGKKKKVKSIPDMVDLGEGYDVSDPFIDNGEAYDEVVPVTLTTKFGGFYINSGVLDFREVSENSDDEFHSASKKRRKKRQIASDSDSELEGPAKKLKKKKKKLEEEKKLKKRKKLSLSSTDGEMTLKKKRKHKDKLKLLKKITPPGAEPVKPSSTNEAATTSHLNGSLNGNGLKSNDLTDMTSSDSTSRDAVGTTMPSRLEGGMDVVPSKGLNDSSQEGPKEARVLPEHAPPLPSLPESLLTTIENIKRAARESEKGKCKFFTGPVNDMLLDIDTGCRQLNTSRRTAVFAHLAAYLPCGQQTLIKRAKKLRINEQDDQLREPIEKLTEAISRVMPAQLERHQQECLIASQAWQEGKGRVDIKDEGNSSDSEEDGEKKDGDKKRFRMPRKRFEWTEELRSLLADIVRIKMSSFQAGKGRALSAEDFLKSFLDAEIKNLWPKGWIQTRMLFKETRAVHAKWTVTIPKPKKPMILTKPGLTVSSTGQITSSPVVLGNVPQQEALVTPGRAVSLQTKEVSPPGAAPSVSPSKLNASKSSPTSSSTQIQSAKTILDYAGDAIKTEPVKNAAVRLPVTAGAATSQTAMKQVHAEQTVQAALKAAVAGAGNGTKDSSSWWKDGADTAKPSQVKSIPEPPKPPQLSTPKDYMTQFEKYLNMVKQTANVETKPEVKPAQTSETKEPKVDITDATKLAKVLKSALYEKGSENRFSQKLARVSMSGYGPSSTTGPAADKITGTPSTTSLSKSQMVSTTQDEKPVAKQPLPKKVEFSLPQGKQLADSSVSSDLSSQADSSLHKQLSYSTPRGQQQYGDGMALLRQGLQGDLPAPKMQPQKSSASVVPSREFKPQDSKIKSDISSQLHSAKPTGLPKTAGQTPLVINRKVQQQPDSRVMPVQSSPSQTPATLSLGKPAKQPAVSFVTQGIPKQGEGKLLLGTSGQNQKSSVSASGLSINPKSLPGQQVSSTTMGQGVKIGPSTLPQRTLNLSINKSGAPRDSPTLISTSGLAPSRDPSSLLQKTVSPTASKTSVSMSSPSSAGSAPASSMRQNTNQNKSPRVGSNISPNRILSSSSSASPPGKSPSSSPGTPSAKQQQSPQPCFGGRTMTELQAQLIAKSSHGHAYQQQMSQSRTSHGQNYKQAARSTQGQGYQQQGSRSSNFTKPNSQALTSHSTPASLTSSSGWRTQDMMSTTTSNRGAAVSKFNLPQTSMLPPTTAGSFPGLNLADLARDSPLSLPQFGPGTTGYGVADQAMSSLYAAAAPGALHQNNSGTHKPSQQQQQQPHRY